MPSESARNLTTFLREQVGDHLRSVLHYDGDETDLLYVRDDVAAAYDDGDRDDVVRDVRLEAVEKDHQEDLYVHGSLNCTVRCFEDAVEMHFVHGDASGTAVVFDSEVFAVHGTFVGRCLDVMRGE